MEIKIWNWLKPNEVYYHLKNYSTSSLQTITCYKDSPRSGDIFYVKKSQFKRWKQDGHSYVARRNGSGIREDREKYSFENDVVQCTYVHGSGSCPNCKSSYMMTCPNCSVLITSVLFHRRAYWLLSNPDLVLCHYLDETQKSLYSEIETNSAYTAAEDQIRRLEEILRQIDLEKINPIKIVEFSPEWGDIYGGQKVLICTDPPIMVSNPQNLLVVFDKTYVNAESVQLGVIKCFTPPHTSGFVDLFLVYEGREITQARKEFEFREIRSSGAEYKLEWWQKKDCEIAQELIENMEEDLNEDFSETEFDEGFFITQFARIAESPGWDTKDFNGKNYLHFLCALGLIRALRAVREKISSPLTDSRDSKSPVDIAFIKNHYDCAYELINLEFLRTDQNHTKELRFRGRIQKIQSHVRAWLQQKQFRNIKRAAKTLQKTFRGMVARKNFKYKRQAAILIQKAVRKWLVSDQHKI